MQPTDDELWRLLARRTGPEALTAEESMRLDALLAGDASLRRAAEQAERIARASAAIGATEGAPAEALARVHARMRRQAHTVRLARASTRSQRGPVVRWLVAAAVVAVLAGGAAVATRAVDASKGAPALSERVARRGERVEFRLADGSRVVLAPASRLRYPESFGATRRVELEGEGYFTVAHDTTHPFIVVARGTSTRAVGTAFDVRAYSADSAVEVLVSEGRVALSDRARTRGDSVTYLVRGDRARARRGEISVEHGVDVDQALVWTRDRLRFDAAPIPDVMRELGRWYDLDITVSDSALLGDSITVTIEHALADDALRRVTTVMGARYERHGRIVRVFR